MRTAAAIPMPARSFLPRGLSDACPQRLNLRNPVLEDRAPQGWYRKQSMSDQLKGQSASSFRRRLKWPGLDNGKATLLLFARKGAKLPR